MCREQERQGEQLEELKAKDGKMWRKTIGYALTAVIGGLIGFVFTRLGISV